MDSTLPTIVKHFDELPASAVVPLTAAMILLGTSRATLYRLFNTGTLNPVKVGGATKLKVSELRRLIAGEVQS